MRHNEALLLTPPPVISLADIESSCTLCTEYYTTLWNSSSNIQGKVFPTWLASCLSIWFSSYE